MRKIALENGVLDEDIILEDKSTTTIENCTNIAILLKEEIDNGLQHIILVSSEWHLKRCLAIAMKHLSPNIKYSFAIAKDGIADKDSWEKTRQ